MTSQAKATRNLRVFYWNAENRVVTSALAHLERYLSWFGTVRVEEIHHLDHDDLASIDLLVVNANSLNRNGLIKQMADLERRLTTSAVSVPVVFLSDVDFAFLESNLPKTVQSNWYYDIVHSQHMDSLPVRVANLIRIHDHLAEIDRYSKELSALQGRADTLETEVANARRLLGKT